MAERIAEAHRLAQMGPGEWRAYYKDVAARLGMAPRDLEGLIKDILKAEGAKAAEK